MDVLPDAEPVVTPRPEDCAVPSEFVPGGAGIAALGEPDGEVVPTGVEVPVPVVAPAAPPPAAPLLCADA